MLLNLKMLYANGPWGLDPPPPFLGDWTKAHRKIKVIGEKAANSNGNRSVILRGSRES